MLSLKTIDLNANKPYGTGYFIVVYICSLPLDGSFTLHFILSAAVERSRVGLLRFYEVVLVNKDRYKNKRKKY